MKSVARALSLTLTCIIAEPTSSAATGPSAGGVVSSEYQSKHLVVSWRAISSCGDAKSVAVLVQELLGEQLTQRRDASAIFEISAAAKGLHVVLDFSDGIRRGRRSFDVESCEAALDASTLVLAVVLEPNLHWDTALARLAEFHGTSNRPTNSNTLPAVGQKDATAPEPVEALPASEPLTREPAASMPSASVSFEPEVPMEVALRTGRESVPSPSPSPPSSTPPARRSSEHVLGKSRFGAKTTEAKCSRIDDSPLSVTANTSWHVASRVLVDTATLPSWSVGYSVGVGVELAPVSIDVSGLMLEPRDVTMPGDSTRGASTHLLGGEVRLCSASRAPDARFVLRPCTSAILAAMVGDAFGGPSRHAAEIYVAGALGADAALRIRRDISVTSGLDVVVPVRRVSVVFSEVDRVLHRTPTALHTWLGMVWAF
ncbi:MAG: hypothetical protein QM784_08785 [Polyangiaceae bacterium]